MYITRHHEYIVRKTPDKNDATAMLLNTIDARYDNLTLRYVVRRHDDTVRYVMLIQACLDTRIADRYNTIRHDMARVPFPEEVKKCENIKSTMSCFG